MQSDIITAIRPFATRRLLKKRTILLYQGEIPRAAYALVDGMIKVYNLNNSGEEQIVTFQAPGDIFPSSWIFKKASSSLYYYEALCDCEVLTVPRDILSEVIDKNPALTKHMLNYFITNYTGMLMRITALEQSRASEKIMFTLYYLLFRYGRETKPGVYRVELTLTHNTIAGLVGLTRETTAMELSKLKRLKVLEYTARDYFVHKPNLERMLGEDSFKDLNIR